MSDLRDDKSQPATLCAWGTCGCPGRSIDPCPLLQRKTRAEDVTPSAEGESELEQLRFEVRAINEMLDDAGFARLSEPQLTSDRVRGLLRSHVAPTERPLPGAPRELWLAKGNISGQWEHHSLREPTVPGWQHYVRADLVDTLAALSARSATGAGEYPPSAAVSLLREYRALDKAFEKSMQEHSDHGPLLEWETRLLGQIDAFLAATERRSD